MKISCNSLQCITPTACMCLWLYLKHFFFWGGGSFTKELDTFCYYFHPATLQAIFLCSPTILFSKTCGSLPWQLVKCVQLCWVYSPHIFCQLQHTATAWPEKPTKSNLHGLPWRQLRKVAVREPILTNFSNTSLRRRVGIGGARHILQ